MDFCKENYIILGKLLQSKNRLVSDEKITNVYLHTWTDDTFGRFNNRTILPNPTTSEIGGFTVDYNNLKLTITSSNISNKSSYALSDENGNLLIAVNTLVDGFEYDNIVFEFKNKNSDIDYTW